MGKALKPFLVLNLILAIVAGVMSYMLYSERQVIKARTLLLEDSVNTVASNLKVENAASLSSALNVTSADQLSNMKSSLNNLGTDSKARQAELEMTSDQLAQTKDVLQQTEDNLSTTQDTLSQTSRDLSDTKESLNATEADLMSANQTVRSQKNDISNLNDDVQNLNGQIQQRDDSIATLEIDLDKVTKEYLNAKAQYEACKGGADTAGASGEWKGRFARILAVDNDWNYVIIDKGEEDSLQMFLEAHAHRGEEYIGKLVVTRVEEKVAVAEIKTDSLAEGITLQANDTVFF